MRAIKARFDGEKIVLPEEAKDAPVGNVIVIFDSPEATHDRGDWDRVQEKSFADAWDNPDDAIYDEI
ncbi:MAG: hypothetical protein R6V85_06555 [Polyangia bacterium]